MFSINSLIVIDIKVKPHGYPTPSRPLVSECIYNGLYDMLVASLLEFERVSSAANRQRDIHFVKNQFSAQGTPEKIFLLEL